MYKERGALILTETWPWEQKASKDDQVTLQAVWFSITPHLAQDTSVRTQGWLSRLACRYPRTFSQVCVCAAFDCSVGCTVGRGEHTQWATAWVSAVEWGSLLLDIPIERDRTETCKRVHINLAMSVCLHLNNSNTSVLGSFATICRQVKWQFWVISSCSLPSCFCTLELLQQIQSSATTFYVCSTYVFVLQSCIFLCIAILMDGCLSRENCLCYSSHCIVCKIAKSDYWLRHVCLSVRTEQLDSHWTDFREIWFLNIFRKFVVKIQV